MSLTRINLIFLHFLLFTSLNSWGESWNHQHIDEKIHVTNNHETMPVYLHGDLASDYLILVVHGGPGSDVKEYREYYNGKSGLQLLEGKYIVAYWQQRGAGESKGIDDTKYYSINQYVSDLDHVIDTMKSIYPHKKIVLFGHSWGGTLTSSYLLSEEHRKKIDAWIDAAGVSDGTHLFEYAYNDLTSAAKRYIDANQNAEYWNHLLKMVNVQNALILSYSAMANIQDAANYVDIQKLKMTKRGIKTNQSLFPEIVQTNNNPSLKNFTKPVLLIWGKYDYCVSKKIKSDLKNYLSATKVTDVE